MTGKESKKINAGVLKYATTVARSSLCEGTPNVELREHGKVTVAYYYGAPYAAYWFEEDEIVFRFLRPDDDTIRKEQAKYYQELSVPKDWLEYRRPLSKSPIPDLESKRGQVMGKNFFEMSQGKAISKELSLDEILTPCDVKINKSRIKSIVSNGGPYITLPTSKLNDYPGFEDEQLNERIFKAATEEGALLDVDNTIALVLGTPDTLYWFSNSQGGVLVRVSHFDEDDDQLLAQYVDELDENDWSDFKHPLKVDEPLFVFDSALAGTEAEIAGLELSLVPANYQLASRTFVAENIELLLVRFHR